MKVQPNRTFEFTRILLQSIFDNISDSINWKNKDSLHSKEELSLDNNVKLTSNSCSTNYCTKKISHKSTSDSSIDTQASNYQFKCPILDKLGFATSSLQDNCIDTIHLKNMMKKIHVFSKITVHKRMLIVGVVAITKSYLQYLLLVI